MAIKTFYVKTVDAPCVFPDGGEVDLKPGQAAMITDGSFTSWRNAGSEPMVMIADRSGPAEKIQIISYETRKDIRQQVQADT